MPLARELIVGFGLGIIIGVFYFYALWWTVRRLPLVQRKGLWLTGSFMVRMAFALGGFYLVLGDHWERLLACLVGFIFMRFIFSRRLGPESGKVSDAGGD